MLMLHRSLVLIAAAAAFQPAEAANPAFAAASKAHLESMDAYFTCAFAAIRASREKGFDSSGYLTALNASCAAEERLLRERSARFGEARGMTPDRARVMADEAVAAARRDLVHTYSGQ